MKRTRMLWAWAACCAALGFGSASAAEDAWPARPISMIVPFPPGGVADTVGRPVAEALGRALGQSVVVENRGGAGGGLGMGQVARAAPDGYTIMMTLSSISILPEADSLLGRPAMYQLSQFVPIARFTADPTVLVVRADSPWRSARDFIESQKEGKPGAGISYGSSGNYGTMHVPMAMLANQAGLNLLHVPYTGAGPAVVALLAGQVDAVATGPASILQYVKAGKVRVLASWGNARLDALPDVPTLTELGHPVQFAQWSGLFVPAGTPAPVVARLREAARAAASDPRVLASIQGAGSPVMYQDAPEFADYWAADARRMAAAVKQIGRVE